MVIKSGLTLYRLHHLFSSLHPVLQTPFAKHIPRDFVRAWTDGKQPEIISQQLEQNECECILMDNIPTCVL